MICPLSEYVIIFFISAYRIVDIIMHIAGIRIWKWKCTNNRNQILDLATMGVRDDSKSMDQIFFTVHASIDGWCSARGHNLPMHRGETWCERTRSRIQVGGPQKRSAHTVAFRPFNADFATRNWFPWKLVFRVNACDIKFDRICPLLLLGSMWKLTQDALYRARNQLRYTFI